MQTIASILDAGLLCLLAFVCLFILLGIFCALEIWVYGDEESINFQLGNAQYTQTVNGSNQFVASPISITPCGKSMQTTIFFLLPICSAVEHLIGRGELVFTDLPNTKHLWNLLYCQRANLAFVLLDSKNTRNTIYCLGWFVFNIQIIEVFIFISGFVLRHRPIPNMVHCFRLLPPHQYRTIVDRAISNVEYIHDR